MKKLIKHSLRYLKSVYWYLYTSIFSRRFETKSVFENIYIICPGPSLSSFKKRVFPENTLLIFVNHSAKISKEFKNKKLMFTSDTTRAIECLEYEEELKKIILVGHFFQLKSSVITNYDFIIPEISFDFRYGIIGKPPKQITFQSLGKNSGVGFGSFLNALSFAIRFNPKTINLIGCDFGEKKDKKYAFKFDGINSYTPFSDIYTQYKGLSKIIIDQGISINKF